MRQQIKDVVGEKYNRFTIVEMLGYKTRGKKKEKIVRAQCVCGNFREGEYRDFKRGKRKSCGCINEENKIKFNDGDKFGFWTVISEVDPYISAQGEKSRRVKCICICGKEKDVVLQTLVSKKSNSCGCKGIAKIELPEIVKPTIEEINKNMYKDWKVESYIKKYNSKGNVFEIANIECKCGDKKQIRYNPIDYQKECRKCKSIELTQKTKSPEYKSLRGRYKAMKARCYNPNHKDYKTYGERGITVCDEWKNNFSNFYNWAISNGYKKELQLDRADNDGNYTPDNCQFISQRENSRKTTRTKFTMEDAYEIREGKFAEMSNKEVALVFDCIPETIRSIRNFKTWAY